MASSSPQPAVGYHQLKERSDSFFRNNPGAKVQTSSNLLSNFASQGDHVAHLAAGARPVVHEDVVALMEKWILLMRRLGTEDEQRIYKEMTPASLVERLLSCRPLAFLTSVDSWLAKDGRHGAQNWDETARAQPDLFLSYDEIKVSALVQASTPTLLINSGSRDNVGRVGEPGTFIKEAVYVGAVGARFELPDRMEHQEVLVTPGQNKRSAGYGLRGEVEENRARAVLQLFAEFYKLEGLPAWDEVNQLSDYHPLDLRGGTQKIFINREVYIRRIQLSAETFLLDADERGKESQREVYCHVVGLGLGVWQIHPLQNALFLEAWVRALKNLLLTKVTDLDFSWVSPRPVEVPDLVDGSLLAGSNVMIHFSRRDPFARLPKESAHKLVVAMFAWDGNSYVGNEYWDGMLSASGDPAAACCSLIPELLNPDINPALRGPATMVASPSRGLVPIVNF